MTRPYEFVGDPAAARRLKPPRNDWLDLVASRRIEALSTTRMASFVPLATSATWLAFLIYELRFASA